MTYKTIVSSSSDENDRIPSPNAVMAWRLVNLSEDLVHALWTLYETEFLDLYHDEMLNELLKNEELDQMAASQDFPNENG